MSPDNVTSTEDTNTSSQKMPLLEAPLNPSFTSSSTDDDDATPVPINTNIANAVDTSGASSSSPEISSVSSPLPASGDGSNKIITYTVQPGDNISTIAEDNNISVNTILWANNLTKKSTIRIGQKLIILPISGVYYKVVSGDTLEGIVEKFKGDISDIKSFNGLDNDTLQIGETIVIPDGEETSSSALAVVKKVANAAIGVGVAHADTVTDASGYYMRPIKAGVRTQGIHGNNAVDLADSCGTSIYASAAGNVIVSKDDNAWNGGYGNYVVISHNNGSETLYAHMEHPSVSVGDYVSQGQMIGAMGETGEATGCHVHFEIRNGPVNPF